MDQATLGILLTIVPLGILLGVAFIFLRYFILPKVLGKTFDWLVRLFTWFR